jgi:CHAT domain-containing protein
MSFRPPLWCVFICCLVTLSAQTISSARTALDEPETEMATGSLAFEKGAFEDAITHWQKAAHLYEAAKAGGGRIDAAIHLAAAHQSLGQTTLAIDQLTKAVALAEAIKDRSWIVQAKSNLGTAYSATRRTDLAELNFQQALQIAKEDQNWATAATIYNNLGSLRAEQENFAEALDAFRESVSLAQRTTNRLLVAKAMANSAYAAARAGLTNDAASLNDSALAETRQLDVSHDQAYILILCGQTFRQLAQIDTASRSNAQAAYTEAQHIAETMGDQRAASYALGYLGQLYEDESRRDEALPLTRRAVFLAQQTQSTDALYRWEWQTARLLKARGDIDGAVAAYRRAIQNLQTVRIDLSLGCRTCPTRSSFRESFGAVFFELADLLLQEADSLQDPQQVQQKLLEARDTVERLKSVELEDYFHDECVNLARAKSTRVENVSAGTAVLYLIPLPDRTEVLVSYASEMARFKVPVGAEQLTAEVREFRRNLEKRTTYEYLVQAQHLYDWLIRPVRAELIARHIQTLVFVPDGALRTIPLAALHDGDQFLVHDFAVAVTPGLTLTEPKPVQQKNARLLLAGLSQGVQGFAPLDYVPREIQSVRGLYKGDVLLNEKFSDANLKEAFSDQQFSVVHIASHGQFDQNINNTFLLTYDKKLTLDDLEALIRPSEFRGKPVELLALSACQTAAGDDRAALGLAGVAVKAGARSALATLWFVNDQASTYLISEFYSQWNKDGSVSKARALQLAQLKMLADRRYRHPCYWAPYLVIGNWL